MILYSLGERLGLRLVEFSAQSHGRLPTPRIVRTPKPIDFLIHPNSSCVRWMVPKTDIANVEAIARTTAARYYRETGKNTIIEFWYTHLSILGSHPYLIRDMHTALSEWGYQINRIKELSNPHATK